MGVLVKRLCQLLVVFSFFGLHVLQGNAFADGNKLFVVTNQKSIEKLSKSQIRQIYLNGGINIAVKPLGFESGDKLRSIFNIKIIGLTESRIEAYWAQMKFTGKVTPPQEFSSTDDLLSFLENNSGFIAYLPGDAQVPDWLNVVYIVNY